MGYDAAGFFSEVVREKAYSIAGVKEGQLAADIGAGTGVIHISSMDEVLGGTGFLAVIFCRSTSGPGTFAERQVPPK